MSGSLARRYARALLHLGSEDGSYELEKPSERISVSRL